MVEAFTGVRIAQRVLISRLPSTNQLRPARQLDSGGLLVACRNMAGRTGELIEERQLRKCVRRCGAACRRGLCPDKPDRPDKPDKPDKPAKFRGDIRKYWSRACHHDDCPPCQGLGAGIVVPGRAPPYSRAQYIGARRDARATRESRHGRSREPRSSADRDSPDEALRSGANTIDRCRCRHRSGPRRPPAWRRLGPTINGSAAKRPSDAGRAPSQERVPLLVRARVAFVDLVEVRAAQGLFGLRRRRRGGRGR
jgi:hypothetical protein